MKAEVRASLPFRGPNAPNWAIRSVLLFLARPLYRVIFRTRFINFDKTPEGPCIISGNHTSYFDPVALYLNDKKIDIHFVAQDGIFKIKPMAWLLYQLGAMKVNRGTADRVMIRNASEILKHGEKLGIFPEGTRGRERSDLNEITTAHEGAAFLATRSNVPIVPVGLAGFDRIKEPGKLPKIPKTIVIMGDPIYPDEVPGERKEKITNMTAMVMAEIVRLRDEAADIIRHEKSKDRGYVEGM